MSNINQILSRIVHMQSQIVQRLNKTPVVGSAGSVGSSSDILKINQDIESLTTRVYSISNTNNTLSSLIDGLSENISSISIDGIIPLKTLEISGNTIPLSNEYNCYKLTPSSTLNLEFDNSNVSEFDGGEFYLMLDFTNGIQTVNFPDTFVWKHGTSAPTINSKTLYIFKCTYLYTDPIAYVGEFITSVDNTDYDSGMWVFNYDFSNSILTPSDDFANNGQTYGKIDFNVPLSYSYIDEDDDGYADLQDWVPTDSYTIKINKGSTCTGINANYGSNMQYFIFGESSTAFLHGEVILNGGEWYGGITSNITAQDVMWNITNGNGIFDIIINDGYWDGNAHNIDWPTFMQNITINGGTVESFYGEARITINGGKITNYLKIGSPDVSDLKIKGGEINELSFYLHNDCSIENANIGIIKADSIYIDPRDFVYTRNGNGIAFIKNSKINTIESTLFHQGRQYVEGKYIDCPMIENCEIDNWILPLETDNGTNRHTFHIKNSKINLLQMPSEEIINKYVDYVGAQDFNNIIIINIDANSEVTIAKNMQNKSYIELVIEDGAKITYLNN